MQAGTKAKTAFFSYKGKPLVRCGDTLYYGNMYDPFVVLLTIRKQKEQNGMNIATDVRVQLVDTNPNVNPVEAFVKTADKQGLYEALDVGSIWLERALEG